MITYKEMTHSQLKELQSIQYEILTKVEVLCEKYNIPYYLLYGTLLGAVRHQGSIPWDYDIDIAMKRKDVQMLMKHRQELSEQLYIEPICYSSVDFCGLVRVISPKHELYGDIHIDIFILDYAKPSNILTTQICKAICKFLHIAKLSKNEKEIIIANFKDHPLKKGIVQVSKLANKFLGGSAQIEKMIFKLRVSSKKTNTFVILEDYVSLPTKYFRSGTFLQYETKKFQVPSEYNQLLSLWYGNYMEIPAEGRRYLEEEQAMNKNN